MLWLSVGSAPSKVLSDPDFVLEHRGSLGEITEVLIDPPDGADGAEGDFIRIIVEQESSDVILRLTGADGERWTADQPLGLYQRELLVVPAASYRLEIESRVAGLYRARWQRVGSGEARLPGDLAWTEGTGLYQRGQPEDRQKAFRAFERAALAYEGAGQSPEAARSWVVAGHTAADSGQREQGLKWLDAGLEIFRRLDDLPQQAETLFLIGNAHRQGGRGNDARAALEQSFDLYQNLGDSRGQARALLNLGLLDQGSGHHQGATEIYRRALEAARAADDVSLQAKVTNNLAGIDFRAGNVLSALQSFEALLPLYRGLQDQRSLGLTLLNVGVMRRALGRYQSSLDAYQESFEALEKAGDLRLQGLALGNLGYAYLRLGEAEKAEDYFRQSLAASRQVGDPRSEAGTLDNLGLATMESRRYEQADRYLNDALELRRSLEDRRGVASTLAHLGRLDLAQQRFSEALARFDEAHDLQMALGNEHQAALTQRFRVVAMLEHSQRKGTNEGLAELLPEITRAVDETGRSGDRDGQAEALRVRARLLRRLGDDRAARADLERALATAEALRLDILSPNLRAGLTAVRRSIYEETVDLLMSEAAAPDAPPPRDSLERSSEAFAVAEKGRARGLLDLMSGVGALEIPKRLRPEHRRLVERLAALDYRLKQRRGKSEAELEGLMSEQREVSLQLDRLERESVTEQRRGIADPRLLGLSELQEILLSDRGSKPEETTRVLVFSLGETRSWAWLVGAESVDVWSLPPSEELDREVERVYRALASFDPQSGRAERELARALAEMLVGERLTESSHDRLVIVPEGALLKLPFAALPFPGAAGRELWVDRFEIAYLPSVSMLPVLREAGRAASDGARLAVIGDPLPAESTDAPAASALPFARREAEALDRLSEGQAEMWLGAGATRERLLTADLRGVRWLHFATHGLIDDRRPELSALLMSPQGGDPADRYLRLHDLYSLRLSADLVTLSGCETGLGRQVRGEGFLGLTRAFFSAGAARVAAGLWRVEDRATAELMERFYGKMLGQALPPSRALREAQLELRRETRYKDPFYWAAFVVQGDWRG